MRENDTIPAALIASRTAGNLPAQYVAVRRTATKISAAVLAAALLALPAHGHAQSRVQSCGMLAELGGQIAEWRDAGISRDALKASAEALSLGEDDRSALEAYREYVDFIFDNPGMEAGFVRGSVYALCITR
jgi:hypothetical protein